MVHATVLDMVATHLGIEYKEVLDGILDSEHQVELLSGLLTAGGKAALVFSYVLLPPPFLGESGLVIYHQVNQVFTNCPRSDYFYLKLQARELN